MIVVRILHSIPSAVRRCLSEENADPDIQSIYLFSLQISLGTPPRVDDLGNDEILDIRPLDDNAKTTKYDNIPNTTPTHRSFSWNVCFD